MNLANQLSPGARKASALEKKEKVLSFVRPISLEKVGSRGLIFAFIESRFAPVSGKVDRTFLDHTIVENFEKGKTNGKKHTNGIIPYSIKNTHYSCRLFDMVCIPDMFCRRREYKTLELHSLCR